MAQPGDLQAPAWLQRNWAPKEPFDPSPWLAEGYRRKIEAQKLPLQLQQLELANKANTLAIEHQGIVNDQMNEELNIYQEEIPALRSYMDTVARTPGGALTVNPPPFRSKQALAAIMQRQKMDAETAYGMALQETITEQTKLAAKAMVLTKKVISPNSNGMFDQSELEALLTEAREKERSENIQDIRDKNQIEQEGKLSPSAQEAEDLTRYQRQKRDLEVLVQSNPTRGDLKSMLMDVSGKVDAMIAKRGGLKAHLSMTPEGGLIVDLGEGQATVGTQTAIQTDLANIKNSISQINRSAETLTEKDVGVSGGVWDTLVNRWVTQLIPSAGDPSVSANRAQLQKAVDSYLESQQGKGRLSASERNAVRETLVTQKLSESLPRARAVLGAMARMQKIEAISKAKTAQQPLQPWMFDDLTQAEIRSLYQDKIISPDEALTWSLKAKKKE